jgi:hypothetical protein
MIFYLKMERERVTPKQTTKVHGVVTENCDVSIILYIVQNMCHCCMNYFNCFEKRRREIVVHYKM